MKKLPLFLCFIVLAATGTLAFAEDPVDFDLAKKSQTKTVLPGSYTIRLLHAKPGKAYRSADDKLFKQKAPDPATAADACSKETLFTKIDPVAADATKSESDLATAIESAVNGCQGFESKLRKFLTDRTAFEQNEDGTKLQATVEAGKPTTTTIVDPGKEPWKFTLRESHVDLDLVSRKNPPAVPPGDVIIRLVNALPGKEYRRLTPDGDPKQTTTGLPSLDADGCTGVEDALKGATTEEDASAKITAALANCTDAAKKAATVKSADKKRTVVLGTTTVTAGDQPVINIERVDKSANWTFVVKGDGSKPSAPPTADESNAALLRKLQISGLAPTIDVTCKATDENCPKVFVSASGQSSITITDVAATYPAGDLTVRITGGEIYGGGKKVFFQRHFKDTPAKILVSLNLDRMLNPSYGGWRRRQEGLDRLVNTGSEDDGNFAINVVTQGRIPRIIVAFSDEAGNKHSPEIEIVYQRWFVDTGGFLTITNVTDEELVTTPDPTKTGEVKIAKKRNKDRLAPGTGAVLDFHPANYPRWAVVQFGIATSQDRQLSYFLGSGYRLQAIGSNALATFAGGIAAVPSLRFSDVTVGENRSSTDPALKGRTVYRFGPYISFSFGIKFGDTTPSAPSTDEKKGAP